MLRNTGAFILGAIVLFIWSFISWGVLTTWHSQNFMHFSHESTMTSVISDNAPQSGIYLLQYNQPNQPATTATPATANNSPLVFAAVSLQGAHSMKQAMVIQFITQLVTSLLVVILLASTSIRHYFCKLGFVFVFALAAAIYHQVPYWTWWNFPTPFTLVSMIDSLIGWVLAGLIVYAPMVVTKAKRNG